MDNHLRALRDELGATQESIAEKAGISRNTYGVLERGKSPIMNQHIEKIAKALNANFEELLYGREKAAKVLAASTPGYSAELEEQLRQEYEERLAEKDALIQEMKSQLLMTQNQKRDLEKVLYANLQKQLG